VAGRRAGDRPAAPRISPPDLPEELEVRSVLSSHDDLLAARLEGLAGDVDAAHSRLSECLVVEASVDRLDLAGAVLTDVEIDQPRVTELVARTGRWRNVRVTGGRLGTLDLSGAEVESVELVGVRVDYLSLAQAKVADLALRDCALRTLDLPHAELARVRFEDSRADEVDTRGLSAVDVDLRGLEALAFTDPTSLRGATLSGRQVEQLAPDLARALGIDVRD
jgi:uncharacterized protein YjbI with pentapeptide repeats